VFVVNFDEWGGFFDHVPPPRAQAANAVDTDIVDGKTLLGFRLPVVIASPFSRGDAQNPRISSLVFDHTSVLKLIEWRWRLAPLTPRDASGDIDNLAYALNFNQPQTAVPNLPKPDTPAMPTPCLRDTGGMPDAVQARKRSWPSGSSTTAKWKDLQIQAAKYGFKVG
jgi:phospholipase C